MQLNRNARTLLSRHIALVLKASGKAGSSGRWPMPVLKTTNEASIHSEPHVAQAFFQRVSALRQSGKTIEAIGKLFPFPSPLARLTMIQRSRAIWKLSLQNQVAMYNDLADILASKYVRAPFCQGGRNILLPPAAERALRRKIRTHGQSISPHLMAQLDGRLWLYSEMIFSRWHNLAHEFHGPYEQGRALLVKAWHDLRGMGGRVFSTFPYTSITGYEFYAGNSIRIDIHNRLTSTRQFAPSMTQSFLQIDGTFVGKKTAERLMHVLDVYLDQGARFLASRTRIELIILNAEMEFFAIKPLADALEQDWRPPAAMKKNIRKQQLDARTKAVLAKLSKYYEQNNRKSLRLQYDPSVRFA